MPLSIWVRQPHAVAAICSTAEGDLEIPKEVELETRDGSDTSTGEESEGNPETPSEEGTGGDPQTPSEEETGGSSNTTAGEETGGDLETLSGEESGGSPETASGEDSGGNSPEETDGFVLTPGDKIGGDLSLPGGDGDDLDEGSGGDKDNAKSLESGVESSTDLISLGFPLFLFAFALVL